MDNYFRNFQPPKGQICETCALLKGQYRQACKIFPSRELDPGDWCPQWCDKHPETLFWLREKEIKIEEGIKRLEEMKRHSTLSLFEGFEDDKKI